jgi:four helix bundle protein
MMLSVKKDFIFRVRISRKEAKESTYFLRLMRDVEDTGFNSELDNLIQESIELTKIFSSIIEKSK